jgi:di/tricarboxylate transporter
MEQTIVFATLLLALGLFIWGRIRHDFVAVIALLILVVAGIVDPATAFSGFGHPAVITVAAVLIIGQGLDRSGLVDWLGTLTARVGSNHVVQVLVLSSMVALASAFMNNVGALAIFMPVAIQLARKNGHSPSYLLMPIAFASLLGGMTTLIGTPPNIIIAAFRGQETGVPFGMFDFSPVGAAVTTVGVAFIAFVGWRLLPHRETPKSDSDLFDIDDYITEVEITNESRAAGKTLIEFMALAKVDMQILGMVRDHIRIHAPAPDRHFEVGDIVILEIDADELQTLVRNTGVCLVGHCRSVEEAEGTRDIVVLEAVVMADSPLAGRSVSQVRLRNRHSLNLLAVARKESRIHRRLVDIIFRTGDVLLLQGREDVLREAIPVLGCLPLARRGLTLGQRRRIPLALGIFGAAIGLVVTGLLPVQISFTMAAGAMVLTGVLPIKEMYHSIDWPVIVLLGAMLPVGMSLESSGGAHTVAQVVMTLSDGFPTWLLLSLLMLVTMLLSAVINNAATVLLMAPIAMGVARELGHCVDPYLMTVAIGGSAAFLTPIGHQSNTLVMGPGGYRFADYLHIGVPLTILMLVVGVPVILWVFPL